MDVCHALDEPCHALYCGSQIDYGDEHMSTDTYNGWTNRSTWLVNLHLTNDQGLYNEVRELLAHEYDVARVPARVWGIVDDHAWKTSRAADALKDHVEDMLAPNAGVSGMHDDPSDLLAADLIGTALAHVEWREVAEGLLDDIEHDAESGSLRLDSLAFLATVALAAVPVTLVTVFVASLAGAVAGVA